MNIQARLKQAEERAMLLQKKADTIHLIMVKPVPGTRSVRTGENIRLNRDFHETPVAFELSMNSRYI